MGEEAALQSRHPGRWSVTQLDIASADGARMREPSASDQSPPPLIEVALEEVPHRSQLRRARVARGRYQIISLVIIGVALALTVWVLAVVRDAPGGSPSHGMYGHVGARNVVHRIPRSVEHH